MDKITVKYESDDEYIRNRWSLKVSRSSAGSIVLGQGDDVIVINKDQIDLLRNAIAFLQQAEGDLK